MSIPRPKICIVGASNMDLISYAPRLPKLGETVPGTRFQTGFGGKGANQAVMASKLGGAVTLITKLGHDLFGEDMRKNFVAHSIDTTYVSITGEAASGVAPIWVEEGSGNNAIIVALGANDLLLPEDVSLAEAVITTADILVCQWEIQTETVMMALTLAHDAGVKTIFNPAPVRAQLPAELYAQVDVLCPNESETELLTGMPVGTPQEATDAAQALLQRGVGAVILTLGARGSLVVTPEMTQHVPAPTVAAVDTTGAGDAFVGSLAYYLGAGASLPVAVARANFIAARSVQAPGTQASFPGLEDLPAEWLV